MRMASLRSLLYNIDRLQPVYRMRGDPVFSYGCLLLILCSGGAAAAAYLALRWLRDFFRR